MKLVHSDLLDRVEQGEEIVITRHGKAIARLVPNTRRIDQSQTRELLERIRERAGRLQRRKPVPFNRAALKKLRDQGRP